MQLSLGRIVHYKLSAGDVAYIDNHLPMHRGQMVRNAVREGQIFPAMVVSIFNGGESTSCNLKVFLDGEDCYWATSRSLGDGPGLWSWPPRV